MQRITAFKTDDGTIFDSSILAFEHECRQRLRKALAPLISSYDTEMADELIDYLLENSTEINECLSPTLPPKAE